MVSNRERSGNINLVLPLENTPLLCALRVNPTLSLRHANLKVGAPKPFTVDLPNEHRGVVAHSITTDARFIRYRVRNISCFS
jgi:hypothetical protein